MTETHRTFRRGATLAGLAAGPWFAVALMAFAARVPEYRHALHPVALLGATGMPGACLWNLLGYLIPGALAIVALQGLHRALREAGAGFAARVGITLLMLSALGFAAQGLLPMQLGRAVDTGPARLHVMAWTLWWLSALAGFALLAAGRLRRPGSALAALAVGVAMGFALHTDAFAPTGALRERIALALWFGWMAVASWRAWRQP